MRLSRGWYDLSLLLVAVQPFIPFHWSKTKNYIVSCMVDSCRPPTTGATLRPDDLRFTSIPVSRSLRTKHFISFFLIHTVTTPPTECALKECLCRISPECWASGLPRLRLHWVVLTSMILGLFNAISQGVRLQTQMPVLSFLNLVSATEL